MAEQNVNNLPLHKSSDAKELDDDSIPDDALPLCPKCLQPCNPLQDYCANCDSNESINPLASYVPFVRIRFVAGMYGKIWRRICYDKDTSIIRKLFFLIFIVFGAPIILIVGLPLFLADKIKNPQVQKTVTIASYIILFLLLMLYLFIAFRNLA